MARRPARAKVDPFMAFSGVVPWRDDTDAMEAPLFSLAKGKRTAPIRWRSADGARWVEVTANATHGMATIYDRDVIIWAISQLNEAMEKNHPTSPVIQCHPHDLLKAIRRSVSGKSYQELEATLHRLKGTTVETNIRADGRNRKSVFSLLDAWEHETDAETGRTIGMRITLSDWFYEGAVKHRRRLAVSPDYFDLSSGVARFLYLQARRHGGKQVTGFRFSMKLLHERSGSIQPMREFARAVRKVANGEGVPDYSLKLLKNETGEVLVMVRAPEKVGLPQRRDMDRLAVLGIAGPVSQHVGSPAPGHVGSPAKARGITRTKSP